MDTQQQLRTLLHDSADRLHVGEPGPEAVRHRAVRRRRRHQAGIGGLTVLALAVAGGVSLRTLDERASRSDVVLDDGDGATAADGPETGIDRLGWREGEGTVGVQDTILVGDDGAYYALATAPGTRFEDHPGGAVPEAIYRSADGARWDVTELGEDPWIADLGERDGVLYAVSTAPAAGGTGQIGVSDDGGATWRRADLPSTVQPPAAAVPVGGTHTSASLAVGDDVMVATVRTEYVVDADAVFPGDQLEEGRFTALNDEGLALLEERCQTPPVADIERGGDGSDPRPEPLPTPAARGAPPEAAPDTAPDAAGLCNREEPAVVDTASWDELGLEGPAELVTDELFVSTDGESWERVDGSPFGGRFLGELTATSSGFIAVTTDGEGATALLRSTDGRRWEPVPTPPGADGPDATLLSLGVVGDRLVAIPSIPGSGLSASISDDGGRTWSRTDLSTLVEGRAGADHVGVVSADSGPLGVAVIAVAYEGDTVTYTLLTSPDGGEWSATPLERVVGDEPPGGISWLAVGADTIAFTGVWSDGAGASSTRTFVGAPIR